MRLVVFSTQHAHGGQERNTPLAVPVKTPQQKHRLLGNGCDTRDRYRNSSLFGKGKSHGFPHDGVDFVALARKLRNSQMTVFLSDRGLGPRTSERRTRREQ